MATWAVRASNIIDALTDPSMLTDEQKQEILADFCRYVGIHELDKRFGTEEVPITDISQLTVAQKAQVFIGMIKRAAKSVLRRANEDQAAVAAQDTVVVAGDTGEAKLP